MSHWLVTKLHPKPKHGKIFKSATFYNGINLVPPPNNPKVIDLMKVEWVRELVASPTAKIRVPQQAETLLSAPWCRRPRNLKSGSEICI